MRFVVIGSVLLILPSNAFAADAVKPKFGPEAEPIFAHLDYLRKAPAADYWNLSVFYVPQITNAACTLAAATMAVNALRGLPADAAEPIITQEALLQTVGDSAWSDAVVEDGTGTTFIEFAAYAKESLRATGLADADVIVGRPADDASGLSSLRQVLAANEASDDNVLLVAFNQGVVTGDWDGPHASLVAAYDAVADKVLIMDVDREWYIPYWTSTETLLKAMNKPAPADQGILAGEHGGYILMTKE